MSGSLHRGTIWRRALHSIFGTLRRIVPYVPTAMGALILLLVIPTIGNLLSTETGLTDGELHSLKVFTDCEDLYITVDIAPYQYDAPDTAAPADSLTPEVVLTLDRSQSTPCGSTQVSMTSTAQFLASGKGLPRLTGHTGGDVNQVTESTFTVDLGLSEKAEVRIDWPGLFQYSHIGHGLANRLTGERAAAVEFSVRVIPFPPDPALDKTSDADATRYTYLDLIVTAPMFYEVSYASDFRQASRDLGGVTWTREYPTYGLERPANMHALTRFRTPMFEAKTTYITMAGGSLIGLGITLLVQSFLAALRRFERIVVGQPNSTIITDAQSDETTRPERGPEDGSTEDASTDHTETEDRSTEDESVGPEPPSESS